MTDAPHWIAGETEGGGGGIAKGTPALVDRAAGAAEAAFVAFAATPRADRAALLRAIADGLEAQGAALTEVGVAETGLPAGRLDGERGRTCGQLRLFADHIEAGDYLDRRHDTALPDRQPLPRPDLRLVQRPVGPVAVFGASNFPLAFSVAGGDTASALAAGCPVVVKGHPAHPSLSALVAGTLAKAVADAGLPGGVFSMIQDGGVEVVGKALVEHPLIAAVGFTGSLRGGRALFDLCAARPVPIPFYGELGSINPMFLLPGALAARGAEIGTGWAGSLAMGAGQFCTNPGVAVAIEGEGLRAMADAAAGALAGTAPQTMLTEGIAQAYREGTQGLSDTAALEKRVGTPAEGRNAAPFLFETSAEAWLADPSMSHEVFGPSGILVTARDADQMMEVARRLDGQLTVTLHLEKADHGLAQGLVPVLERKAGRLLVNGFPTGVEVAEAMVHGGPYPASTNFGATSVGTLAIRRWLRPVCYQNMPEGLLPADLG